MAHLSLTFLGSFQAILGRERLTRFRSAKVQGLLIYLALRQKQPQARERLAALLWPDEPDAVAKKNLRQSLYQLRQIVGRSDGDAPPHLLVTRVTAQFNPDGDHSFDVSVFRSALENGQLEEAVRTYTGDLLPGFSCDSAPFEAWLREERAGLHRQALAALSALTARRLAEADYQGARQMAQRQLALEPWREEAHRQLMQALALLGERSAALAQYSVCRAALAEELDVAPAAETEALVARIREQAVGGGAAGEPARPAGRRLLTTPFVGRQAEHGALVRAYRKARSNGAQVVALVGEAGIGKTRLVHHFLAWATTQGADILRGRAFETSGRLSYHPLTQALRRRLERENAPEDLLSDLWLTQLTRILPELRDRYPDLPEPTQEENVARQHLFEAMVRLGQALAERGSVVIFIDDWHWADAASLDVMHYAALRWVEERTPILVLLTLRQEAVTEDAALQAWLTHLEHGAACRQLDLAALSDGETEQMIHTLLTAEGDGNAGPTGGSQKRPRVSRFSRWLFEETDGQPFFLVETLKALSDEGLLRPDAVGWQIDWARLDEQALAKEARLLPGVQGIIRGWLERISNSASQLLTAAAVLGQEASFERLWRVAGLNEIQALSALDELLVRQLLLESGEASAAPGQDPAYSFSHQKLKEVVYAEAGAARRRVLHRRAFAALQATDGAAAELAHHAQHAGLLPEATRYSIAAGNEAMRLLAMRVAVAHYETAWQLVEQVGWPETIAADEREDVYANLGRAYEVAEAWAEARETYRALITYARATDAPTLECLGLNRLATVLINGFNDSQQATTLLEEARSVADASADRRGLVETEWNLSLVARRKHRINQAREHGERALGLARELGHPQLMARCLNSLAYVHSHLRDWPTVEIYASEGRELYAATGGRVLEADCQRLIGWSQVYVGRPRESLATLRETYAFSRRIENVWGEVEAAYRLAHSLSELGRYGEAIGVAREAAEAARTLGIPGMMVLALSTWGYLQRKVMALEAAQETLMEVPNMGVDSDLEDWALAELCAVHALQDDWEQAHDYARQARDARTEEALLPMTFTPWYGTEALLRGGDGVLARREVEWLGRGAGNNRRYRLPWHRSRAVLARWDGDLDEAVAQLQAALALAREIGLPGEEWPLLAALADHYGERGDAQRAQAAQQAAARILHPLAESIDDEGLRAGFLAAEPVSAILRTGTQE